MHFTFDGIASQDMGVILASPDGGMFEEIFLPDRDIIEKAVVNNNKPYFQRVDLTPLSFPLTIFIHEWKDRDNLRQLAKWMMKDYYAPLTFESNPDRIYYAIFEGSSALFHNGIKEGYLTLNVRCNSPYTYSHKQLVDTLFVRNATTTSKIFRILNTGDLSTKPKMWIRKKLVNGTVSILNEATEQLLTINNLIKDEEVYFDMENETILTNRENLGVYRYADHNGIWLELAEGENTFVCTGDFDIEMEYEMVYLAD